MKWEDTLQLFNRLVLLVVFSCLVLLSGIVVVFFYPELLEVDPVPTEHPWQPKNPLTELPDNGLVRYGFELISNSSKYIGPLAELPAKRYAGNNLSCQNCHLGAGTVRGSASFVGVANRFPQFRGRENKMGTLAERINGCMERSLNGKAMPVDSREMQAMIAYMKWLSKGVPADREEEYKGFVKLEIPNVKADLVKGKALFTIYCQRCHMEDGNGQMPNPNEKHIYPPLWGADSYNHGAGMHRIITAAQFIKANMPFEEASWERPKLTDEEAYHVAAYINSFPRPQKSNPEADFPDKKLKPVSTPYGPWADPFSPEQHKYGPFQPIMRYYQKEYGIKKTK